MQAKLHLKKLLTYDRSSQEKRKNKNVLTSPKKYGIIKGEIFFLFFIIHLLYTLLYY